MKNLLIFASGDKEGGGSGFQLLVENSITGILKAKIVGVVSNHKNGGVKKRADKLGIPFYHMPKPFSAPNYQALVSVTKAEFVSLSGWLKMVEGLDPKTTINIHPGPLRKDPETHFGGKGLYGHYVHEAIIKAFREGRIKYTEVTMHFVTGKYDDVRTVFFRYPIVILPEDTPESLAARVNIIEHGWQSYITDLVVNGKIHWDGKNPESLSGPGWYRMAFAINLSEK